MTRTIRVRLCTAVVGGLFCVTAARAVGAECDVITLSGKGELNPESLTIAGTETLMVRGSDKAIPVEFTAEPLGVVEAGADGTVKSIYSHEFKSVGNGKLAFTTIDEIKVVPLPPEDEQSVETWVPDPTCMTNMCGLVFRLKLIEGRSKYNCGEIVSGYDPVALPPFSSYAYPDGNVIRAELNSRGKLCKCSGNN